MGGFLASRLSLARLHADLLDVPTAKFVLCYESAILRGGIHGAQYIGGGVVFVCRGSKSHAAAERSDRASHLACSAPKTELLPYDVIP